MTQLLVSGSPISGRVYQNDANRDHRFGRNSFNPEYLSQLYLSRLFCQGLKLRVDPQPRIQPTLNVCHQSHRRPFDQIQHASKPAGAAIVGIWHHFAPGQRRTGHIFSKPAKLPPQRRVLRAGLLQQSEVVPGPSPESGQRPGSRQAPPCGRAGQIGHSHVGARVLRAFVRRAASHGRRMGAG